MRLVLPAVSFHGARVTVDLIREAAADKATRATLTLNDKPVRRINSLSLCRTRMYQYTSEYVCVRRKFQQTGGVFTWHGC
jgi:hypothetical protein